MLAEEYLKTLEEKESDLVYKRRKLENFQKVLENHENALQKQEFVLTEEEQDVDNLSKTSIGNLFNKLLGKMDQRIEKEEREYFEAKVKYDELKNSIVQMKTDVRKIQADVSSLKMEVDILKESGRRQYPEVEKKYTAIENEIIQLKSEEKELLEAIDSGKDVTSAIQTAVKKLESARGWATYDMFTKGGIISHMAKYGNIDEAQAIINRIGYLMDRFQAELNDVNQLLQYQMDGYDSSTRFIDYFFDNIFTDMMVRGRIDDDIDRLNDLNHKVDTIVNRLVERKKAVVTRIMDLVP